MMHKTFMSLAMVVLLAMSSAFAAGGKVSGRVVFKGKPVEEGKIIFHLDKGQFVGSAIKDDGTYEIDRIPVGIRKVTFEGKGVPAKYTKLNTAVLTVDVKEGDGTFDFNLQ